jgi:ComF family protein
VTRWRTLANLALSSILAPPCAVCRQVLTAPLAGAVCASCWSAVIAITPPVCVACGDPLPSNDAAALAGHRCAACRKRTRAVDAARAVGSYEGALRAIVHALKYDGRRSLVPRLAQLMHGAGAEVLAGADGLVPVPLHPRRRRARGFNQAADLARAIGLPVIPVLHRVLHTPPQVDLPADARWRNVRDAFACLPAAGGPGLCGAVLVLVDDVTTTGATLDACARVLKAAGAREVRALTAARVVSVPR